MARTYHLPKSARTKHDGFKRERNRATRRAVRVELAMLEAEAV